jgi:hypothetical protein
MTRTAWIIVVALWAVAQCGVLLALGSESPLAGGLVDPDSYQRVLRVREWLDGGWYDARIERNNAPIGEVPHWTRPLDALIVLLHAPLRLVGLARDQALLWAGALSSPLLHLALLFMLPWTLRPILDDEARALASLVALAQPAVFTHSMIGRADHHGLIALAIMATIGFTLRALAAPARRSGGVGAGVVAGAGLWVSVETLLPLLLVHAALALAWLRRGGLLARAGLDLAVAFLITVFIALLVERPPAEWFTRELDRLSIVHFALGFAAVLAWAMVRAVRAATLTRRGFALAAGGALSLAAMALIAPRFFLGPMADVDPRLVPLWLDGVAEVQPLFTPGRLLAYLGPALVAVPYALSRAGRHDTWLPIGLGLLVFVPLAMAQVRFADEAELMLIAPIAALAAAWSGAVPVLLRPLIVLGLTVGSLFAGLWLEARGRSAPPGGGVQVHHCPLIDLARHLDSLAEPRIIVASPDLGPELLWRTHHAVLASPYHRNATGMLDAHAVLAATDDAAARSVMARRGARWVLICPISAAERNFFEAGAASLYARLARGEVPLWLAAEPLPGAVDSFRLYRLRDGG